MGRLRLIKLRAVSSKLKNLNKQNRAKFTSKFKYTTKKKHNCNIRIPSYFVFKKRKQVPIKIFLKKLKTSKKANHKLVSFLQLALTTNSNNRVSKTKKSKTPSQIYTRK